MKYKIVAVGKIKENYFRQAIEEYSKRISRFSTLEICEVEESYFNGIPNAAQISEIIEKEGKSLLQKCVGYVVALDIDGQLLDSERISQTLADVEQRYSCVTFVIGGSYGLSAAVKNRADLRLSFGKITLPHQLCRVTLCEQIYRACAIRHNVPYHK